MDLSTPSSEPRTEHVPSAEPRKRFVAPCLVRHDRLPALTGDASFDFPPPPPPPR